MAFTVFIYQQVIFASIKSLKIIPTIEQYQKLSPHKTIKISWLPASYFANTYKYIKGNLFVRESVDKHGSTANWRSLRTRISLSSASPVACDGWLRVDL